ncbi:MAG: MATE family efflux transporter [Oscillospiraceae bacterium]|nr:MATE family efflux transporter [Oscillospiraceae bacterium]
MNQTKREQRLLQRTLRIAVPIMVQNLITNFVALLDNIMVGQVGTEEMSGVAIVNQLMFVFNITIFGVISGGGIFCAQFFGKADHEGVRHVFRFKMISAMCVTVIGILVFFFAGDPLIRLYLHETEQNLDLEATFGFAKQYLAVMLLGLVPFSLEQVYAGTLREGGITVPPMIAGIIAVCINTCFNALLIFGIGPFPKLGVVGAAIATLIARVVQCGIVIIWTHTHKARLPFVNGLFRTLRIPVGLRNRIMWKGLLPLTANECLWSAGVAVLTQCYSLRGLDVVAGLNISSTVVNLFNVLYIAFGSGVSVVIGQMLGANHLAEAKKAAPKLIWCAAGICVMVGGIMACFAGLFPMAYNTTDVVRTLATKFILVSAVLMPIHGLLHAMYFTLRAGGKTYITFLFDCGFSWCVTVPIAFVLSRFTDLPILAVYSCAQGAELIKVLIGWVLIQKGVWISNIVVETEA